MSGGEMLSLSMSGAGMLFLGWRLLYKEEQYTLLSWLALAAVISQGITVGSLLIS